MKYRGYEVREATYDKHVINELSSYKCMPLLPQDVVLDIGANIGSFAKYAAGIASHVFAVEPEPDNYALLELNVQENSNVTAMEAAVVSRDCPVDEVLLYVNDKLNKGAHSVLPTRGRPVIKVAALRMDDVLAQTTPDKVKVDCEGAEYDILVPSQMPTVRGLVMEYHLTRIDQRNKAAKLHQEFLNAGFRCPRPPKLDNKAWHTLAYYER